MAWTYIALALTLFCRTTIFEVLETGRSAEAISLLQLVPSIIENAIEYFRRDAFIERLPIGNLTRAVFYRLVGNWEAARLDFAEIDAIAMQGPLKLMQCDVALERVRLALAEAEGFPPLSEFIAAGTSEPVGGDLNRVLHLQRDATDNLALAQEIIDSCGYHRRDAECAELGQVLQGMSKYKELRLRV